MTSLGSTVGSKTQKHSGLRTPYSELLLCSLLERLTGAEGIDKRLHIKHHDVALEPDDGLEAHFVQVCENLIRPGHHGSLLFPCSRCESKENVPDRIERQRL